MPQHRGRKLPIAVREAAIEMLQSLIAAGVSDVKAQAQVAEKFDVTKRSVRNWINTAYRRMAGETQVDRKKLLGLALKRRRMAMAKAAANGDWRTYLAACDSEARLLGLDAPKQTEHHVLVERAQDMSRAVVEVVRDHFLDDPAGRARFVKMLQDRLNTAIEAKAKSTPVVLEAEAVVKK